MNYSCHYYNQLRNYSRSQFGGSNMNKDSEYVAEEVRYTSKSTLILNLGYIWSVFGILKIIEFILLLIAWSLVANFQGYYSFPITIYYLIVTSIAWVYVILEFLVYFFNVQRRLSSIWPYLIFGFLAALVFLIDALFHYREYQDSYKVHCHYSKY
ncbi:hypothetical protein MXB_4567 [Myxobolus squamalis]|nr:hypothetical protein MXB_4567 [Myxobolus squamalis]